MQPIDIFKEWLDQEIRVSSVSIPTAACLSTIGIDNFPNARFVSLKQLINDCFVITGPLNSRKGIEIAENNNVALTFWWTATEKQVRIQGTAKKISCPLADKYFSERDLSSQAVSAICEQGKEIDNLKELKDKYAETVSNGAIIDRPDNWGGFLIKPVRIEFMEFKKTRFHDRKLYETVNDKWTSKRIQP